MLSNGDSAIKGLLLWGNQADTFFSLLQNQKNIYLDIFYNSFRFPFQQLLFLVGLAVNSGQEKAKLSKNYIVIDFLLKENILIEYEFINNI